MKHNTFVYRPTGRLTVTMQPNELFLHIISSSMNSGYMRVGIYNRKVSHGIMLQLLCDLCTKCIR